MPIFQPAPCTSTVPKTGTLFLYLPIVLLKNSQNPIRGLNLWSHQFKSPLWVIASPNYLCCWFLIRLLCDSFNQIPNKGGAPNPTWGNQRRPTAAPRRLRTRSHQSQASECEAIFQPELNEFQGRSDEVHNFEKGQTEFSNNISICIHKFNLGCSTSGSPNTNLCL